MQLIIILLFANVSVNAQSDSLCWLDEKDAMNVKASLTAPTGAITLMESYNLSVSIGNGNASIESVEYFIKKDDKRYRIASSAGTFCNEPARKTGVWDIEAVVTLAGSGKKIISNMVQITVQFPDVNTIINNVESQMDNLWQVVKEDAKIPAPGIRRERGFWIFVNTISMNYEVGTTIFGDAVSATNCEGTNSSIVSGVPGREEIWKDSPVEGGRYWVAFFHAHTPVKYCKCSLREVGPSDTDVSYAITKNAPCILYDYKAVRVYDCETGKYFSGVAAGHKINAEKECWRFGPDRRPL